MSGNSFFKLVKDNIRKRIWMLALSITFFFFAFPFACFMIAENGLKEAAAGDRAKALLDIYRSFIQLAGPGDGFMSVLLMLLASVTAGSGFSYLHQKNYSDLMHSLPVKRDTLFHTVNAASLVILVVPYVIASLLSAVFIGITTGMAGCVLSAAVGTLVNCCFMSASYMLTAAAFLLTGRTPVGILGAFILHLALPVLIGLASIYRGRYFRTLYHDDGVLEQKFAGLCQFSSPLFLGVSISEMKNAFLFRVLAALAAGILLTVFCLRLYRKRRLENAEKAMAFDGAKAPVRIFISVVSGLLFGYFLRTVIPRESWTVIGIVIGTVLSAAVTEIIFASDFRKLFDKKAEIAAAFCLAFLFYAFFRFDLAGVDRYIPRESEIAGCYAAEYNRRDIRDVNVRWQVQEYPEYTYIGIDPKDETEIFDGLSCSGDTVRKIAEKGRDKTLSWKRDGGNAGDEWGIPRVLVSWILKNGKTVRRLYHCDPDGMRPELLEIMETEEYRKHAYPVLGQETDDLSAIYLRNGFTSQELILSESDRDLLLKTYQEELLNCSPEILLEDLGEDILSLQFFTKDMAAAAEKERKSLKYQNSFDSWLWYPVYPSFEKTRDILSSDKVTYAEERREGDEWAR